MDICFAINVAVIVPMQPPYMIICIGFIVMKCLSTSSRANTNITMHYDNNTDQSLKIIASKNIISDSQLE